MTTLVGTIIDTAARKAMDEDGVEWDTQDLLTAYAQAMILAVSLVPSAYTQIRSPKLVAGIQQSLTGAGLRFRRPIQNMGTDGATLGAAVTAVRLEDMNELLPDWATETAAATVQHVIIEPDKPDTFLVYPPNDGTGYLKYEQTETPPATTYDDDGDWRVETCPLNDEYAVALVDGILYQCFDDETDIPGNNETAAKYYGRFLQMLGVKEQYRQRRRAKAKAGEKA